MKILALITARGGSKRIPGKNIRQLGEYPLIVWTIKAATGIPEICDILVSTDVAEIADVARNAGALVPWLRPEELANDVSSSADVALHALDWYEQERGVVDGLLLLQPTSPFRTRKTIERGITLFLEFKQRSVVGVSPAESHPMWCFKVDKDVMRPFIDAKQLLNRSQDLPPAYVVNGSFYLLTPSDLRERKCFYSDDTVPMEMDDPREAIDIDTEWDWMCAEAIVATTRT